MKLFELFNRPAEYDWVSKTEHYGNAMFVTGDATYKVLISSYKIGRTEVWSIQFEALANDADDWTIGNTGTGAEYEVFSTVVRVARDYMSEYGAKTLHMQTNHAGRASLYPRMLKRLLPQWQVHVDGNQIYAIKPGDAIPEWDDGDDEDDGDRP